MKFLKRLRIKTQIIIVIPCFSIILLIIIFFMYGQSSNIVLKKNKQYTQDAINKFEQGISQKCEEIKQTMLNLSFDPFIQKYMRETNSEKAYEMSKDVEKKIIASKTGRNVIEDICIIGNNDAKYSVNGSINYVQQQEEHIVKSKGLFISGLEKSNYSSDVDCIMFAQNVYSNNVNDGSLGTRIGYIVITVNIGKMFFNTEKQTSNIETQFYLIDSKGKVYPKTSSPDITKSIRNISRYSENQQEFIETISGVKGIVQFQRVEQINGTILSFVPEQELFSELSAIRIKTIIIVLIALILMTIPILIIVNNIISPIQKLVLFAKTIKDGNLKGLKTRIELDGNVEMIELAGELNGMLEEINILTNRLVETTSNLYKAEVEKEKAAHAYLRSQINPHFLYNTLESIKGVAIEEGVCKIVDMTKALGKLLHYSIKGTSIVTLGQELEIIKSYIFLQLIRFEERFDVIYEFEEDVLDIPVLKMILQPIVENAITHGLESKPTKGMLTIGGKLNLEGNLEICIKDDGLGIEAEKLHEIEKKLGESNSLLNSEGSGSIGIYNVNNRLKLTYGSKYGVTLKSVKGEGTCVTLFIPATVNQQGEMLYA